MGTSQTFLAKPNSSGLDLEKTSRLRSRRKFFLDIPFDRTHGLWRYGVKTAIVKLADPDSMSSTRTRQPQSCYTTDSYPAELSRSLLSSLLSIIIIGIGYEL